MYLTNLLRSDFRRRLLAPLLAGAVLLAACGSGASTDFAGTDETAASTGDAASDTTESGDTGSAGADSVSSTQASLSTGDLGAVGSLSSVEVHDIGIELDTADFEAMVAAYNESGEKEWIEATVTIDGVSYTDVGLRLKGNSSLRGVSANDDPASLPWLIKLDKFVDGQSHDGLTEMVVRSNSSETSLNEAVALELLDLAGLASQDAVITRLSVNGSEQVLRLVIDNPEDDWMAEELDASGALYKAESTGDYSYRGDDPESYTEVFDQEAGDDNADLTPLIEFLDFINNSDDATFAAELGDRLDVDAFATYLAMQDLLENFDDIDGPGNNSYLYYDTASGQFTVVPWDYNLAFGSGPGGPGGEGRPSGGPMGDGGGFPAAPDGGGAMPAPGQGGMPAGGAMPGGRGPGGRSNVLVERFTANEELNALYQEKVTALKAELFDSGAASEVLAAYAALVADSGLVDQDTIDTEAAAISAYFS